ncbi:type VII secretion integral membrane protein EccD [Citricoccus nitrophenolicus]|uniref:Type VII secretion integral membrane protein EccD n=1 Tax=Citricoccus nitrophenolicus TaxID=863575 RepID=A0ABV0IJ70_9MICC|nr:type VII secretion integral membrane protein EccD [Citricoccus sp. I39-566]WMY78242.1 type VII secretion integral membrane protein EccD [Citricoccus sp. I39-566]
MPSPYTRVALVGQRRNADLLLPSDTPLGTLMPQILDLLGDQPEDSLGAKLLVRADGGEVPPSKTLAESGVLDGERLRLVSRTEAPPSPIVYDLNDTVSDHTEAVPGRWSPVYRYIISGLLAAVGSWLAITRLLASFAPEQQDWVALALAAVALVAAAALSAPGRRQAVAGTLAGAGTLFALSGLMGLDLPAPWSTLALAGLAALVQGVLGFIVNRPLSMFISAAVTGALVLVWAVAPALSVWAIGDRTADPLVGSAAIAGIAALLVLGLLPKIALGVSGLAGMDDRHANGAAVLRRDVGTAIDSAHGGLISSAIVCAVSAALSVWIVGGDTLAFPYSLPLLACLVLALGLRARAFPLAAQRIPLYLATGLGVLALVRLAAAFLPEYEGAFLAALLVLALVAGAGLSVDLPEHSQARMRKAGDTVEAIALLAPIPLLIGYYGIYATLLETF